MAWSSAPYRPKLLGDTQRSPYKYECKFCGMKKLAWGMHGEHRRLFESLLVVHECTGRIDRTRKVCNCSGFADFELPVELYNDHRFNKENPNV